MKFFGLDYLKGSGTNLSKYLKYDLGHVLNNSMPVRSKKAYRRASPNTSRHQEEQQWKKKKKIIRKAPAYSRKMPLPKVQYKKNRAHNLRPETR